LYQFLFGATERKVLGVRLAEPRKGDIPMTAKLPSPLADYFAATNAHDVPAMSAAFTEDAVVKDEGREHHGLAAIRKWMKETIEKYDYQVDPIESSRMGKKTAVLVSLHGKFPGSPITLQYELTLEGQKIARLEIG
jgi:SnoaL-like domain